MVKNYFTESSAQRKTPTHLTSFKCAALDLGWDRSRIGVGNSMSGTHHLKDKKICSPPLHRGIDLAKPKSEAPGPGCSKPG